MLDRVAKERGARSPVIIIVPGAGLVHPGTGARAGKGAGLGYYTRVEFYWVVIKPECVGVVRDAILGKDRETAGFQYILENLEVDADGWLDWNWDGGADSCGKYRKDGELAAWLSRYCEGGFIVSRSLEGDGASWAYEFDGKGGVSECSARRPAAIEGWLTRRSRNAGPADP